MSDQTAVMTMFLVLMGCIILGVLLDAASRQQREAREWEEFAAEHCRISGTYDREAGRASPVIVAGADLNVYHCDDGTIHIR